MEKETSKIEPKLSEEVNRVYELFNTCNNSKKPNPKAREELKRLIKNTEIAKSFMEIHEDFYEIAQNNRIENFQVSDAFKEVVRTKCRQLREELGYAKANKLEKLAIEQIALCWLNYHQIELSFSNLLLQSHNTETGLYWEKRLDFASRRYNRALETLSKMRKLNLNLQINNAQNQIVKNG